MLRLSRAASDEELQERYSRLAETYRLVAEFAGDDAVYEIAALKFTQLLEAGEEHGLEYAWQKEGGDKVVPTNFAERYYLQAGSKLRYSSGIDSVREAVASLQEALVLDPTNTAYIAVLEEIEHSVREYEEEQLRVQREREQREREREEQNKRERRRRRWSGFFGGIGDIIETILYKIDDICCDFDSPCTFIIMPIGLLAGCVGGCYCCVTRNS